MDKELKIAFIGGGNMSGALVNGLVGKRCSAADVHIVDTHEGTRESWAAKGVGVAAAPDEALAERRVWIYGVKPQVMAQAVARCRPFLQPDTLVISVAAGISSTTLSRWLGAPGQPFGRVVRAMPNTPALIGEGATALLAAESVSQADKELAQTIFKAVSEVVWVDSDKEIDIVTSLSGSGPAYVFLFLEALIDSAVSQGLDPAKARKLAMATVSGATELAALSADSLAVLRERVTSKGGTTAAALSVFEQEGFSGIVHDAMAAAANRAHELSSDFT
ncbi:MAG: pyrroline-5-carboxylate reductase [Candidimonas sp.]|jgi:pyrroline-5-carboxylate reductase